MWCLRIAVCLSAAVLVAVATVASPRVVPSLWLPVSLGGRSSLTLFAMVEQEDEPSWCDITYYLSFLLV